MSSAALARTEGMSLEQIAREIFSIAAVLMKESMTSKPDLEGAMEELRTRAMQNVRKRARARVRGEIRAAFDERGRRLGVNDTRDLMRGPDLSER